MSFTFWILVTACLAGATCGLIGSFLLLRRMVMMGDAISHAVLPGIVVGYLWSHTREPWVMLVGAGVFGLITAWFTELIQRNSRVEPGAALGVVFTFLFAVGVILVSLFAGRIDLDADCVLYGEIAYVPWDLWIVGETSLGPRAVWMLGGSLVINLAVVLFFYKELKVCAFDPEFSESIGISTRRYHYLLMTATSLSTVAAFESVGAILVVAMLVIPAAVAALLTRTLPGLLIGAIAVGCACAVAGYALATWWDSSISGSMAVAGGMFFLAAVLFSPQRGILLRRFQSIAESPDLPAHP